MKLQATCLLLPVTSLLLAAATTTNMPHNGDFELADGSRPRLWDKLDGLGVQWLSTGDVAHGKAIRMDTRVSERAFVEQCRKTGLDQWVFPKPADNAIAETYGLSYYSDAMPIVSGQAYRVTVDVKGGKGAKLWIRCYGFSAGEQRRVYETQFDCPGQSTAWTRFTHVFFPTKFRPAAQEMRVMLYAYYPPDIYWFDNVVITPITTNEYDRAKRTPTPATIFRL